MEEIVPGLVVAGGPGRAGARETSTERQPGPLTLGERADPPEPFPQLHG
jgi:hypothetical protein